MDLLFLTKLPEWLRKNLPTLKKLQKEHPREFLWGVRILISLVLLTFGLKLLCWFVKGQPRWAIEDYLSAINTAVAVGPENADPYWDRAHSLLDGRLAGFTKEKMMEAYGKDIRHENIQITLPEGCPSTLAAWWHGKITLLVTLDYKVTIRPTDRWNTSSGIRNSLWAQLKNAGEYAHLRAEKTDPDTEMDIVVTSTRRFEMIRSGLHWKIDWFKGVVMEGIKYPPTHERE